MVAERDEPTHVGDECRGHTAPEYATVILAICGLDEEWSMVGNAWHSTRRRERDLLHDLVDTIRRHATLDARLDRQAEAAPAVVANWLRSVREGEVTHEP